MRCLGPAVQHVPAVLHPRKAAVAAPPAPHLRRWHPPKMGVTPNIMCFVPDSLAVGVTKHGESGHPEQSEKLVVTVPIPHQCSWRQHRIRRLSVSYSHRLST